MSVIKAQIYGKRMVTPSIGYYPSKYVIPIGMFLYSMYSMILLITILKLYHKIKIKIFNIIRICSINYTRLKHGITIRGLQIWAFKKYKYIGNFSFEWKTSKKYLNFSEKIWFLKDNRWCDYKCSKGTILIGCYKKLKLINFGFKTL